MPEVVSEWLGMTVPQCEELRYRLNLLRSAEEGYGSVRIDVRRSQVYRMSHQVDGKPVVFREEEK